MSSKLSAFIVSCLVAAILKECRAQLIPAPKNFAATTMVTGLSFDYSVPGSAPMNPDWVFSLAAANTSSTGALMTTVAPGLAQGSIISAGRTTSFALRVVVRVTLSYNPTTPGQCSLFGFLLADGVSLAAINSDDTITNFKGIAVWMEICPGGRVFGYFSSAQIPLHQPPNPGNPALMFPSCTTCTLGATVPSQIDFVIQVINDKLSVGMQPVTDFFSSVCFSNVPLAGFTNLITMNPLLVNFVTLNGHHSIVKVSSIKFYQLGAAGYGAIKFTDTSPFYIPVLSSPAKMVFDTLNSFDSVSNFAYRNVTPKAITLTTPLTSLSYTEGSIISPWQVAHGASAFRAELTLTVSSITALSPSTFFYFAVSDQLGSPLSAVAMNGTGVIPTFKGLLLRFEIGTVSNTVLFYSSNITENYPLDASEQCLQCTDCQLYGPTAMDYANGSTSIAIQLYQDLISVSIMPRQFQTALFLFSNFSVPGLGKALANSSSYIQFIQHNGANAAKVTVSSIKFWANAIPITTSTVSVPTTTFTTTELPTTAEVTAAITGNGNSAGSGSYSSVYGNYSLSFSDGSVPIPSLIQGSAVPLVTLDDILHCPWVQPTVRGPNADLSTKIYFSMSIDRLLEIDDIDQTIKLTATLFMQWGVFTCSSQYTASNISDEERIFVIDHEKVWHPKVIFANSSDDVYMQATQYGSDMQVLYLPTKVNRTLFFYWTRVGVLSSKCNLDLRRFPFDSQTCDFTFLMKEPYDFLNFAGVYLKEPIMSPNGQWRMSGSSKTTGMTPSTVVRNGQSSYATFQITFNRNPSYHVYNLLVPCYVLIALVFASFFMPPEKPDRPVICCTILLAFVVAQSEVLKEVPHTSESILLAEYILFFTGLTGLVTTHDMIMCGFSRTKWSANRLIHVLGRTHRIRVVRGFDIAAFLLMLDFFIAINLYALLIIFED